MIKLVMHMISLFHILNLEWTKMTMQKFPTNQKHMMSCQNPVIKMRVQFSLTSKGFYMMRSFMIQIFSREKNNDLLSMVALDNALMIY